jgi:hypothetical protein
MVVIGTPMSKFLLAQQISTHLVKNFFSFSGNEAFITAKV